MKKEDISPIFLANLEHKKDSHPLYFSTSILRIVKLKCINPTKELIYGDTYWAYKDFSCSDNFRFNNEYPVYKIYLYKLGWRKYKPTRFKVLDELETSYKQLFK
jgi:hypothetical protein